MENSIPQLLSIVRRWWWLFLLGILVGGSVGYSVSARAEPMYSASTMIQVIPPQIGESFDPDSIEASTVMALTYRQLVWNQEVLAPVIEDMELPYDIDELRKNVFAWTITGTQIIEISVQDHDPEQAATIANNVGASLIAYVEADTLHKSQPLQAALESQLADTAAQIEDVGAQIVVLEQRFPPNDIAVEEQINQLRTKLDRLNDEYADLRLTQQRLQLNSASGVSPLKVATPAEPATSATDPGPRIATVFGSAFGAFMAAAVVIALGYMDKTIKPTTDFESLIGVPLLGTIGIQPPVKSRVDELFVAQRPHATASRAIRALRVNITLRFLSEGRRQLAISSPDDNEGKSTLVANLAIAAAQAGVRTVLVDANMSSPSQHRIFGIENNLGLSTWLKYPLRDLTQCPPWHRVATQTVSPNLFIIPGGPAGDTPPDILLGTGGLSTLLSSIGDEADLVLVDTPPMPGFTDAVMIAAEVEGVILVCRPSKTEQGQVVRASHALQPTGTSLVGVVLSDVVGKRATKPFFRPKKQPFTTARTGSVAASGLPDTVHLMETSD